MIVFSDLAFLSLLTILWPVKRVAGKHEATRGLEWKGDISALVTRIGEPLGGDEAASPQGEGLAALQTTEQLREWLTAYCRQRLCSHELPAVLQAWDFARREFGRELVDLDQQWTLTHGNQSFAEASFRVGRRQLVKLRPMRDQRAIQKYAAAVESGKAKGWHVIVYGLALAAYSIPLRQGLVHFAQETLDGFVRSSPVGRLLSEVGQSEILDAVQAVLNTEVSELIASHASIERHPFESKGKS